MVVMAAVVGFGDLGGSRGRVVVVVVVMVMVCSGYSYGDYSDIYVSNDSRNNKYFNTLKCDYDSINNNNKCAILFPADGFKFLGKFCLEVTLKCSSA
jgi:hypothetical protein